VTEPCLSDIEIRERLARLEAHVVAVDRRVDEKFDDVKAKFIDHNQFREQINKERNDYVTRMEMRWLIGIVMMLAAAVIGRAVISLVR
jgi:NAD(P)-dependent dehydrogenase (short-subunit alcohol dehydrogenase family)